MKKTEREWKAAVVFRTWNAVQARCGMPCKKSEYSRLTEAEKAPFRFVAESRAISSIETAWQKTLKRRSTSTRSPFKESGFSSRRAHGGGGR